MGSGKSTIGRLAAQRVDAPFYDTDLLIEERAGMTIREIWARFGEPGFRRMESDELKALPSGSRIAAAGGGAILDPANRELIAVDGKVVWLRTDAATLARRLAGNESRPLLGEFPEQTIVTLLAERAPLYEALATNQVEASGRTIDDVVNEVVDIWLA
ncbi:MAG: shikimate kinase [Acidimicrobiia bacterium]